MCSEPRATAQDPRLHQRTSNCSRTPVLKQNASAASLHGHGTKGQWLRLRTTSIRLRKSSAKAVAAVAGTYTAHRTYVRQFTATRLCADLVRQRMRATRGPIEM